MVSGFLHFFGGVLAALSLWLSTPALADPPARVGRLAYLEDSVWFSPDGDQALQPAMRNWPISSGAVVRTGERGRAEIWIDSTALRLADDSQAEFARLDDEQVALDLTAGRLAVSIAEAGQATDLVLRVAGAELRFPSAGRYRLAVAAGRSELTALAGQASIEHAGGRLQLLPGNTAVLFADGTLRVVGAERPDAFDRWVGERENLTQASQARRHVSPYMTGYQDLDGHGDWQAHGEYGSVWYPRALAADWAPYRFGRWAWVEPWGWTWIDAAPWGFAPFHYGRWLLLGGRWAWVPGRRLERPVYAPALVAWIGDPGWSVSFGFGAAPAVGWFPLAPREVYVPHYRYSPAYVRRLNAGHVHDLGAIERSVREGAHERYAHRHSILAVTVVPASQLREGRPIGERDFRRVDRHDLGRAPSAGSSPGREWLAPDGAMRGPRSSERVRQEAPQGWPERRPERRGESDYKRQRPTERSAGDERRSRREVNEEAAPPREMRGEARAAPGGRPEGGERRPAMRQPEMPRAAPPEPRSRSERDPAERRGRHERGDERGDERGRH